ncbi:YheC/YheD family protein [Alteribacter aurantiacus]|uniref:YheC/YheD family endospore coat-associated protein n=1 Tax=Alteribacter aurantiacus TaxID=254410 RepID=UPI0004002BB2|nr:YheC/YheD family protein [Alteribacter aurantiacus]
MDTYCLGVMVTENVLTEMVTKQNAIERDHDLVAASVQVGMDIYFFSPEDVNVETGTVTGTYYHHKNEKWVQKINIPIPRVIYRRVAGASLSKNKKLKSFLRKKRIHLINRSTGFNKWKVYTKLHESQYIRPFLPETVVLKDQADVKDMIDKYGRVYLKGVKGGRGRQVMMVEKVKSGYEYSVFKEELTKVNVKKFSSLMSHVKAFYRKQKVIIQEPINLLTYEGRLVDIRVEVQKDGNNTVNAVSPCVRLGSCDAPITTHAKSYPLESFLKEKLEFTEEEVKSVQSKMSDLVSMVMHQLEKHDGPCGEVGIDLGLDKNKKLWFIECNSRSLKVSLAKAYGREKLQEAYKMILQYTKFMCDTLAAEDKAIELEKERKTAEKKAEKKAQKRAEKRAEKKAKKMNKKKKVKKRLSPSRSIESKKEAATRRTYHQQRTRGRSTPLIAEQARIKRQTIPVAETFFSPVQKDKKGGNVLSFSNDLKRASKGKNSPVRRDKSTSYESSNVVSFQEGRERRMAQSAMAIGTSKRRSKESQQTHSVVNDLKSQVSFSNEERAFIQEQQQKVRKNQRGNTSSVQRVSSKELLAKRLNAVHSYNRAGVQPYM